MERVIRLPSIILTFFALESDQKSRRGLCTGTLPTFVEVSMLTLVRAEHLAAESGGTKSTERVAGGEVVHTMKWPK